MINNPLNQNTAFIKTKKKPAIIFTLLYIAYFICYVDRSSINIALSYIGKDFHLSDSALGVVGSAFFLGYALMQIPGGWLADKFGSKLMIIIAFTSWSIFTIFTGFAWSLASLLVIRLFFGICEGPFPSSETRLLGITFPYKHRSLATSGMFSSEMLGAAVAPLIVAPLIGVLGWRISFHTIGVIGLIYILVFYFFLRPIREGGQNYKDAFKSKHIPLKETLKSVLIWQFFLIILGMGMVQKALDIWLPTYLLRARHIDLAGVAWLAPLGPLAGGIAAVILGFVMHKYFKHYEKWLLAGNTLLTTLCMFGMYHSKALSSVIIFEILGYCFAMASFACTKAFLTQLIKKDAYGTTVGVVNFSGQLAGFIAPSLIGVLVQLIDFSAGFLLLVFAGGLSFIACLTLSKKEVVSKRKASINDSKRPFV